MGLLDNTRKKATAVNAREMIIFSYPKVGKTELMTHLPGDNNLIIDFDVLGENPDGTPAGGTDYYDCNAVVVPDINTFNQLRDEFLEKRPKYDYLVLDTITMMYSNIINSIAVGIYNQDQKKNKPTNWDIDKLDYGKGHIYKREAMGKVTNFFKSFCRCLILVGHVKDAALDGDSGTINVKDLDVEGKLKNILALKTDAMGLLYRSKNNPNQNILSFTATTGSVGGTRIQHLANKEIIISEKQEDGSLTTHWDKVFI